MKEHDQRDVPIWAAAKASKRIDVLKEVAKTLAERDRELAGLPIARLRESELETEQLRLEDMLHIGSMTVDDFRRLQEVDYYLEGMRQRRTHGSSREEWHRESLSE